MNWRTRPRKWNDLVQVTDSYVVHARGFTIGEDVWIDHYAVHGGHKSWWNKKLEDEYDHSWDHEDVLYWSVTGSGTFIMQYPRFPEASREQKKRLVDFLDVFGYPENEKITWKKTVDEYKRWEWTLNDSQS